METPREAHPGPQKPLDDAIAEYLMACEVEGKSPRTVQAYDETLRVFRRTVARANLHAIVGGFAAADVYRFLKAIMDSPVSLGTRHRRFPRDPRLLFLVRPHGLCAEAPLHGHSQCASRAEGDPAIHRGRDPALAGRVRCGDRVRLPQPGDHPALSGYRDAGAGVVAGGGGRRQLGDPAHPHPAGQGAQGSRVVPFGEGPEAALRDYITRFRGEAPGCLFLATRGARRPLAPFALTTLFDRLGRRAGVDHAHAHRFRHTFATLGD